MIIGQENKPSILDKLNQSYIEFYPTGSRFFGTSHAASDYDFFTAKDTKTEDFLYSIGFHRIGHTRYKDVGTTDVFRFYDQTTQIDIQFVVNVEMKSAIQEKFKKAGILDPNTEQWNAAALFYTEPMQKINPDYDLHKFTGLIPAIKYLRENFKVFQASDSLYHTPNLIEAKRFVESVMVMAQRGSR